MFALIQKIEETYRKSQLVDVKSGDTVRVHQKIQEGAKTRVQVFEGLVIRTRNLNSLKASILVRRIASGVGVEKGFMLHSPNVEKIEVIKRAKVRRNYLSYMRERGGKSARLSGVDFDKEKVNKANEKAPEPEVPVDTTTEAREAEKALAEETTEQLKSTEEKAESQTEPTAEKPVKAEKTEEPKEEKEVADKAVEKKAKAEAFRQAQQNK